MEPRELDGRLVELPLYAYRHGKPGELVFCDRVRWVCEQECPMYGKSWSCPPGVGSLDRCKARCLAFSDCLAIATVAEVSDITDLGQTLSTRADHEAVTDRVRDILRELGTEPYVLSAQACTLCDRCAIADGEPCRSPERMRPCVESHGIELTGLMEEMGISFQYGQNVVTWISLFFYR